MMKTDSVSLLIFVLVATFTPGPGNIASATMGMVYGYRRTFRFLSGIVSGYLMVMLLCAFLSGKLIEVLPVIEPVFRIAGAGYIFWLAISTLRASYRVSGEENSPMYFRHGFFLQALNPKAVIFGITIYTTFLSGYASNPVALVSTTLLLATLTFSSISLWAFVGAQIQEYLFQERIRQLVNLILLALLSYCAVTLSGVAW